MQELILNTLFLNVFHKDNTAIICPALVIISHKERLMTATMTLRCIVRLALICLNLCALVKLLSSTAI